MDDVILESEKIWILYATRKYDRETFPPVAFEFCKLNLLVWILKPNANKSGKNLFKACFGTVYEKSAFSKPKKYASS